MFELREKIEKVTFWPFLTPEKRNLVWPRRPFGQLCRILGFNWLETRIRQSCSLHLLCRICGSIKAEPQIWNARFSVLEPRIRQSCSLHPCIRNLVHSSAEPDFRQSPPVEPDFRKTGHDPQKRLNFVAKKVKNDCGKKKSFPESIWTRTFCKKRDPNWPFLASTAPFTIYHPHIWGYHRVLYFTTQMTEKYSTAMC